MEEIRLPKICVELVNENGEMQHDTAKWINCEEHRSWRHLLGSAMNIPAGWYVRVTDWEYCEGFEQYIDAYVVDDRLFEVLSVLCGMTEDSRNAAIVYARQFDTEFFNRDHWPDRLEEMYKGRCESLDDYVEELCMSEPWYNYLPGYIQDSIDWRKASEHFRDSGFIEIDGYLYEL